MPPESPTKKNTCAVIVTYYPDDDFHQRLSSVVKQVDRVLVVDNNSGTEAISRLRELPGIELIANDENRGVAAALNQGLNWATERGYAWVLTLDQDTVLMDRVVETFADVHRSSASERNVALIGSNYIDKLTGCPLIPETEENGRPWTDAETVITSGSILSIATAARIGPFREDFFIDHVDDEYCLRARHKGLVPVITRRPLMVHTSGSPRYHKFRGKRLITSHLPAVRRYYAARNLVVLRREYRHIYPEWVNFAIEVRYKQTILMLLFEKDKFGKMCKTIRGVYDGLIGRMGRL